MQGMKEEFYSIEWAKQLITIAQTGLTYSKDPHDIERYKLIQNIGYEMLARGQSYSMPRVKDFFRHEVKHATPKVDVRAAVFIENKILLVKEISDSKWTVPGGWADVGETPSEAIAREVVEESGYQVKVTKLLAVYDKRKHLHPPQPFYVYKRIFECEIIGGRPAHSDETNGVEFFGVDELPELSLDRVTPEQVKKLFDLRHTIATGSAFD